MYLSWKPFCLQTSYEATCRPALLILPALLSFNIKGIAYTSLSLYLFNSFPVPVLCLSVSKLLSLTLWALLLFSWRIHPHSSILVSFSNLKSTAFTPVSFLLHQAATEIHYLPHFLFFSQMLIKLSSSIFLSPFLNSNINKGKNR